MPCPRKGGRTNRLSSSSLPSSRHRQKYPHQNAVSEDPRYPGKVTLEIPAYPGQDPGIIDGGQILILLDQLLVELKKRFQILLTGRFIVERHSSMYCTKSNVI